LLPGLLAAIAIALAAASACLPFLPGEVALARAIQAAPRKSR